MPVLTPTFPPQSAEVRPLWGNEESATAQGLEGKLVRDQMETVNRHWLAHSREASLDSETDLLDELNDYHHPPFEKVGTIRVRFTKISELQPRQIVFDEDDL